MSNDLMPNEALAKFSKKIGATVELQQKLLDKFGDINEYVQIYMKNEKKLIKFLCSLRVAINSRPREEEFYLDVFKMNSVHIFKYFSADYIISFFRKNKNFLLLLNQNSLVDTESIIRRSKHDEELFSFFQELIKNCNIRIYNSMKYLLNQEENGNINVTENDIQTLQLIQSDDIIGFQSFASKTNLDLNSSIKKNLENVSTDLPYMFEKDGKMPTLIEYSAFCSAINVFKFLIIQGAQLSSNLSRYSIIGGNYEIIHILEGKKILFDNDCLNLSVKYHHHLLYDYLKNTAEIDPNEETYLTSIEFFNYKVFCELFDLFGNYSYSSFRNNLKSSKAGNVEIFKLCYEIMSHKPNFNVVNFQQKDLYLKEAANAKHYYMVKYLCLEIGLLCELGLIIDACKKDDFELIKIFIGDLKMDVNHYDKDNWTLFHHAVSYCRLEIIEYLLKTQNVNYNAKTSYGTTPLLIALQRNDTDIVNLLLQLDDIDVDSKPKNEIYILFYY